MASRRGDQRGCRHHVARSRCVRVRLVLGSAQEARCSDKNARSGDLERERKDVNEEARIEDRIQRTTDIRLEEHDSADDQHAHPSLANKGG